MAVWQRGNKWRAELWHKGKRIWSDKFETELEAKVAEAEERENLTEINTGFMKLAESRLEELEIKRSKQHFRENQSLLKNLITKWGHKPRVKREDIEEHLNEVARESKSKANKQLRLIRALFEHGLKRGWIKTNPTRGIDRCPETPRKRYVPPEEDIKKVGS